MVNGYGAVLFIGVLLSSIIVQSSSSSPNSDISGKRWAILVAGSNGYENYRHQADVCHAYQIMKKGGLGDENIIVFMYDDIAFNLENPRPGVIINKPNGNDVYYGVPKDYTGKQATAENFLAALSGNKSALTGGSGKVVNSGPDDYIFIYYADHGAPGLVCMPYGKDLYAKDLVQVLKKKHEAKAYKNMVIYIEACESGSMFEGLLPKEWKIYAVTAANSEESSWAAYCPPTWPQPLGYDVCLGDLFSVSWLEDSDRHDMSKETLETQYKLVRRRTGNDDITMGSHVMEYGDMDVAQDFLSFYMGTNPNNQNFTLTKFIPPSTSTIINQRDANLVHFHSKIRKASEGSKEKDEAERKLQEVVSHRRHVDSSIDEIARALFGDHEGREMLSFVRPSGQPLVDDWDCLKTLVEVYEKHCGGLSWYGKKYSRAIANMCNAGISVEQMTSAANQACFNAKP